MRLVQITGAKGFGASGLTPDDGQPIRARLSTQKMTLLDSGSTNPVVNGHTQKPSNSGHFNIESASGISMRDAGIAVTSGMGLDNPFYAISAELQYLSSGVSLSLEPESRGQEDAGLDGSGIQSRREGGGREWMEAVRRVKDFVERSDDSEFSFCRKERNT